MTGVGRPPVAAMHQYQVLEQLEIDPPGTTCTSACGMSCWCCMPCSDLSHVRRPRLDLQGADLREPVQTKLWYVKTAAFELFSDHVGAAKPAGVPADAKASGALATEAVHHVMSSSAEVKAAAIRALRVMHDMRPDVVARALTAQTVTNANHEEVLQVRVRLLGPGSYGAVSRHGNAV